MCKSTLFRFRLSMNQKPVTQSNKKRKRLQFKDFHFTTIMSTFWVANYHTMMQKAGQIAPFCSCDCGLKSLNPMCASGCQLLSDHIPDKERWVSTVGTQSGHWSWFTQQLKDENPVYQTYRQMR